MQNEILNELLITTSEITITDNKEALVKLVVEKIKETSIEYDLDDQWSGKFSLEIDIKDDLRMYIDGTYYQYGKNDIVGISANIDNCYFMKNDETVGIIYDVDTTIYSAHDNSLKQLIEDSATL